MAEANLLGEAVSSQGEVSSEDAELRQAFASTLIESGTAIHTHTAIALNIARRIPTDVWYQGRHQCFAVLITRPMAVPVATKPLMLSPTTIIVCRSTAAANQCSVARQV